MREERHAPGFILHARASQYYWEGHGLLSIKTFFTDRAIYNVGDGCHAVDTTSYLILNHGQSYSITIDSQIPVESFCIFFSPGFAETVYRDCTTAIERLVDEPEAPFTDPLSFFERNYQHDNVLSPAIRYLRSNRYRQEHESGWLEEQFHILMQRLLQVHKGTCDEVAMLPAVRATTREEIYRRLYHAKDYATALFDQPLTLADIAHVACLSPNHFLRLFKQVFHQTPHQYLIEKRLEHARQLLCQTDRSVTDICFSIGFKSPGSFSWLFRQRVGISPEQYRSHYQKK
jgi:AraC family transcriptional regulator